MKTNKIKKSGVFLTLFMLINLSNFLFYSNAYAVVTVSIFGNELKKDDPSTWFHHDTYKTKTNCTAIPWVKPSNAESAQYITGLGEFSNASLAGQQAAILLSPAPFVAWIVWYFITQFLALASHSAIDDTFDKYEMCNEYWPIHNGPQFVYDEMKASGENVDIDIITKRSRSACIYNKVSKTRSWVQERSCEQINGDRTKFCFGPPADESIYQCVKLYRFPCANNLGAATLEMPVYEKNGSGENIIDNLGNPQIVNANNFKKQFFRHCIIMKEDTEISELKEFADNSLIDETCGSGVNYSLRPEKVNITAKPAQCIIETGKNLLQKPIRIRSVNKKTGHTTFYSATILEVCQSSYKVLVIFCFILILTGYAVDYFNEGKDSILQINPTQGSVMNVFKKLLYLTATFYLLFGNIWSELIFDKLIDASFGLMGFIISITMNKSSAKSFCDFTSNTYPVKDKNETCIIREEKPFTIGKGLNGNDIYGCSRGRFINQPNYSSPYIPFTYQFTPVEDGIKVPTMREMKVYCKPKNSSSSQTIPAIKNSKGFFVCPDLYELEPGYRIAEYKKIGLGNLFEGVPDHHVYETASFFYENGEEINIREKYKGIMPQELSAKALDMAIKKQYIQNEIESFNANYAGYTSIEKYGYLRSMSYIAPFDTLDCQFSNFFQHTAKSALGFLRFNIFLIFAIPILIIPLVTMFVAIFIVTLVDMITFIDMICFSTLSLITKIIKMPFNIALSMAFSPTSESLNLEDQVGEIKKIFLSHVFIPMIGIARITIMFFLIDFYYWGDPSTHESKNMFKERTGQEQTMEVNPGCWDGEDKRAPIACLMAKIDNLGSNVHIPLLSTIMGKLNPDKYGTPDMTRLYGLALIKISQLLVMVVIYKAVVEQMIIKEITSSLSISDEAKASGSFLSSAVEPLKGQYDIAFKNVNKVTSSALNTVGKNVSRATARALDFGQTKLQKKRLSQEEYKKWKSEKAKKKSGGYRYSLLRSFNKATMSPQQYKKWLKKENKKRGIKE